MGVGDVFAEDGEGELRPVFEDEGVVYKLDWVEVALEEALEVAADGVDEVAEVGDVVGGGEVLAVEVVEEEELVEGGDAEGVFEGVPAGVDGEALVVGGVGGEGGDVDEEGGVVR